MYPSPSSWWDRRPDVHDSLCRAIRHGAVEEVKQLLSGIHNIDYQDQQSYLHRAAEAGNPEIILLFLQRGPDLNIRDTNNRTPLHRAAEHGHGTAVVLLVEEGANFNPLDRNGDTPLGLAVKHRHSEVVWRLLRYGAPPRNYFSQCTTPSLATHFLYWMKSLSSCSSTNEEITALIIRHQQYRLSRSITPHWDLIVASNPPKVLEVKTLILIALHKPESELAILPWEMIFTIAYWL